MTDDELSFSEDCWLLTRFLAHSLNFDQKAIEPEEWAAFLDEVYSWIKANIRDRFPRGEGNPVEKYERFGDYQRVLQAFGAA